MCRTICLLIKTHSMKHSFYFACVSLVSFLLPTAHMGNANLSALTYVDLDDDNDSMDTPPVTGGHGPPGHKESKPSESEQEAVKEPTPEPKGMSCNL